MFEAFREEAVGQKSSGTTPLFGKNGRYARPLRLLFLTYHSPFDEITGPISAGAEIAMRRIAERLALRGHEVHFLTFNKYLQTEVMLKKVHVHFHTFEGSRTHLTRPLEGKVFHSAQDLKQLVKNQLPPKLTHPIEKKMNSFLQKIHYNSWRYKHYIRSIVQNHKIDLIHCFSSLPDSLASAVIANKFQIPLTIRMGGRYWYLKYHSLKNNPAKQRRYFEEINYVFENTDCFAFNSKFMQTETRRLFVELGMTPSGAETIIDIGVSLPTLEKDMESVLKNYPIEGCCVISCVGKFKKNSKRQDLLIKALTHLDKSLPIKIFFAGFGPTLEEMKALACELGVEDKIVFLGDISHTQVFELVQASTIFTHPTDFEGSSKALAEAMLLGKPVIASNIPANAEHIQDGVNGFLAENNAESFAKCIQRILQSESEGNRLGEEARRYAERFFDPKVNAQKYEKLFYNTLKNHESASPML